MSIDEILAIANGILQNPIFVKYGVAGLFINGILASTILPIPTEIAVSALLAAGHTKLEVFVTLAISTTIGGFISYYIGRSGKKLFSKIKQKFGKKEEEEATPSKEEKEGNNYLRKYGWIAIAGSAWMPIVGDFIPMVAGAKKYDLRTFAIALSIGKVSKAIAVVYLSSFLIGRLFG